MVFDGLLLLGDDGLVVSGLNLAEQVVPPEKAVGVASLEVLDGGVDAGESGVKGAGLQEAIVNFEEIDLVLVEEGVGELGELALEEVLRAAQRLEERRRPAHILHEHRREVLALHQLAQLAPELRVLDEPRMRQRPDGLRDALGVQILNLVADGRQQQSLVGLANRLASAVSLEHVEGVGGEGDGQVGQLRLVLRLQHVEDVLQLRQGLPEVLVYGRE